MYVCISTQATDAINDANAAFGPSLERRASTAKSGDSDDDGGDKIADVRPKLTTKRVKEMVESALRDVCKVETCARAVRATKSTHSNARARTHASHEPPIHKHCLVGGVHAMRELMPVVDGAVQRAERPCEQGPKLSLTSTNFRSKQQKWNPPSKA